MRGNLKNSKGNQASSPNFYSSTEFFILYLSIPFFAFLAIYLAPVDILDKHSWARALCEEVWRIFPAFKREASHSPFPQVRQFGICLVLALMPLQLIVYLFEFSKKPEENRRKIRETKNMHFAKILFTGTLMLLFVWIHLLHKPRLPLGRADRLMETNIFSAAFTDSGLLIVTPISVTLIVFSAAGLLTKFLARGAK